MGEGFERNERSLKPANRIKKILFIIIMDTSWKTHRGVVGFIKHSYSQSFCGQHNTLQHVWLKSIQVSVATGLGFPVGTCITLLWYRCHCLDIWLSPPYQLVDSFKLPTMHYKLKYTLISMYTIIIERIWEIFFLTEVSRFFFSIYSLWMF